MYILFWTTFSYFYGSVRVQYAINNTNDFIADAFSATRTCAVVDVMNGGSTEDFILERYNTFMMTPNLPEICLQQPRGLPPPPPSLRVDVCDLAAASLLT